MIIDLNDQPNGVSIDCDIAIVGAGAVGITMAAQLATTGLDVVVLEGGGQSLETESQNLYHAARSVGRFLPGLHEGRFRLLGGTTNFWGGQLVRFEPPIFEDRSWLPHSGWPFDRGALDPYYDRVLDVLGMRCMRDDADIWKRLDLPKPDFGEDLDVYFTRWIPNSNLAQVFRTLLEGDRIRTIVHANVTAIDPPATLKAPVGLEVKTLSGRAAKVRSRAVVLACGTIEIVRLLQFPLASGATAPWADSPWLGRGFVDHVDCFAGKVIPADRKAFHDLFDNVYFDKYKYNPKIRLSDTAQRERQLLSISAQFAFHSDVIEHLDNLKLFIRALVRGRMPKEIWRIPAHVAGLWRVAIPLALRYLRSNRAFNPTDRGIELRLTAEQFPNRESRIRLGDQKDALGLPIVEVDWRLDGRELDTLATFAELLRNMLRARGIADIDLAPRLVKRDAAFLDEIDDGYHQMGSARMGRSLNDGVVSSDLAVHGTNGLYVAGAATFPSTGFANPTFTAMALGLRLADHLEATVRTTDQ